MNPDTNHIESTKLQGDKLETPAHENQAAGTSATSAADLLEIPPHEQPQTDGGAKIHGDKLEPHTGKQS